jgi:hypothetical protein
MALLGLEGALKHYYYYYYYYVKKPLEVAFRAAPPHHSNVTPQ